MKEKSGRGDTRSALLEAGIDIMLEKGYTNTGIQEVLTTVGAPKGSFYHYFESKETWAKEAILLYEASYTATLINYLKDDTARPLQRLKNFCNDRKENFKEQNCSRGSLVANLGQEMADQNEELRKLLSMIMGKWKDIIAACISEGQASGQIAKKYSATKLAEIFISGWEGAMLRAKTIKSPEPLDVFTDVIFNGLLKAPVK
jgi:TetR/AcrR family transcriptional repressor of nem operon